MKSNRHIVGFSVMLVLLGAAAFGIWQRQAIYDWSRLRNYVPPAEIAQLTTATSMSDYGRHLFYVNWPELQDKDEFNQSCTDSEKSIVLGCYIQRKGIFLFDVQDKRLQGAEEVTAAHEMLHAAYDRLSEAERERIDELTEEVFLKLDNERLHKTIEAYRAKDPSIVANELHSIVGTEVRVLSNELEEYYSRYFEDRLKLIAVSEKYEKAFTSLEDQAEVYKAELDSLKQQVATRNSQLETTAFELATEFKDLENRRETAEPVSFNIQVRNYNAKVAAYNAEVTLVASIIDRHNQILEKYNAIVVQETELIQAIDSRPQTIEAQ